MKPLSAAEQSARNDLITAEGWVKGHWRTVAVSSLILNVVLVVLLIL